MIRSSSSTLLSYLKRTPTWVKLTIVFALNNTFGIGVSKSFGPSMQPTIDGEFLLVNNFIFQILRKKPSKGDVVLCHPPNSLKIVCKRVHAVEGESIESMKDGVMTHQVIPAGHVWLLGDNPDRSVDSRVYGPVKISNIRGKVLYKLNNLQPVE